MMKSFYIILLLISLRSVAVGQTFLTANLTEPDSLRRLIAQAPQDTSMVLLLVRLSSDYRFNKTDSSLIIAQEAIQLSQKLNFTKGEIRALSIAGEACRFQGEFPRALEYQFNALKISRNSNDEEGEIVSLNSIGFAYVEMSEYKEGLNYLYTAKKINERFSYKLIGCLGLSYIGYAYEKMHVLDSALIFQQQAYRLYSRLPLNPVLESMILTRLGLIQFRLGNDDKALAYYQSSLEKTHASGDILNQSRTQYRIGELYYDLKQPDSSLKYTQQSFMNAQEISQKAIMLDAGNLLAKLYRVKNNNDSAFYYQEVAMALKDSLFGPEKFHRLQLLAINEQRRQQEIQQAQEQDRNRIKTYLMLAGLVIALLIAFILWRNNRNKQKTNILLRQQKEKVESTLSELKSTQAQLIQSEKMASLGELTAGIAHEIQNPLNFVNNFSEVNNELIEELKIKNEKLKIDDREVTDLLGDIYQNNEKISMHGKRADSIVKGMLQHSRTSTGVKEPTDINVLCDEYLRLSYHGLRAKDKGFNADLKTDFDESVGKINIVPQDIGRVLLNLFNNAFYAVSEKQKTEDEKFEPCVSVQTKKINEKIEIIVMDNGNGIPRNVVDKVFQPFFTTKPAGRGTGLGLSLAYDIIKAQGGEIKVETKEGEGSEFIVQLPTTPGTL